MTKKLPPLKNVIKRMMIIVLFALLNRARGTIGWGAKTCQMKKAMVKAIPSNKGARLWALPQTYLRMSVEICHQEGRIILIHT